MRTFITFFYGFIAIALMTACISVPTGWNPILVGSALTVTSFFITIPKGILAAGLNKEIWLAEIMEGFYADDMWVSELRDFDAFVENDKINLAEAGVNPDVIINNVTYPVPIADRNDTPVSIELDTFDTENTSIKNANLVELVYNKLQSVIFGHKKALRMGFMERGAHAIAPAANTAFTPVLKCSGTNDGSGYKKMTFDDILAAQVAFDEAEIPDDGGRRMIISAIHLSHLKSEDSKLYKEMLKDKEIYGFKIIKQASKRLPKYDTADDSKVAFGAVAPGTAQTASLFYHKDEVCRAKGTEEMYYQAAENNPRYRQHEVGFSLRGIVIPIRNKAIGSIFSPAVV